MATEPDIWAQVVSQSTKRLSTKTPSDDGNKKLAMTLTPTRVAQPDRSREAGAIQVGLRAKIKQATTGYLKWPLFIHGAPGSGKTCASLCVADHVERSSWSTWDDFWRYVADVNFGRAFFETGGQPTEYGVGIRTPRITHKWTSVRYWAWIASVPLLVIDDIGLRATANDTQYEALKMALDQRESRPLILTSNLDTAGIGKIFDLRVMDRISGGTVVEITGKSRR